MQATSGINGSETKTQKAQGIKDTNDMQERGINLPWETKPYEGYACNEGQGDKIDMVSQGKHKDHKEYLQKETEARNRKA